MEPGGFAVLDREEAGSNLTLRFDGSLTIANAAEFDRALTDVGGDRYTEVTVDMRGVNRLDTVGAWVVGRTLDAAQRAGARTRLQGARPEHSALLEEVAKSARPCDISPRAGNTFAWLVAETGANTLKALSVFGCLLNFLGLLMVRVLKLAARPWRLRWTAFVHQVEGIGFRSLPIVGLLSFLVGAVMASQGAFQLRKFGAEILVVDMLAISTLRELGIVLTSIITAGRSGSAFAAQIGTMKLHEEVDAMRTMGLDAIDVLVIPRLAAMVLTLPLLTFYANALSLFGGAVMAWGTLDIAPELFIERLEQAIDPWSFWIGLIKAPFFATVIAVCGCFEGLSVSGGAHSVGERTTRAVVESIFLIIVMDALFAMLFTTIGI